MQCLYCKKKLGLFASKKHPFCSEQHEVAYTDEQAGVAMRRVMDPLFTQPVQKAPLQKTPLQKDPQSPRSAPASPAVGKVDKSSGHAALPAAPIPARELRPAVEPPEARRFQRVAPPPSASFVLEVRPLALPPDAGSPELTALEMFGFEMPATQPRLPVDAGIVDAGILNAGNLNAGNLNEERMDGEDSPEPQLVDAQAVPPVEEAAVQEAQIDEIAPIEESPVVEGGTELGPLSHRLHPAVEQEIPDWIAVDSGDDEASSIAPASSAGPVNFDTAPQLELGVRPALPEAEPELRAEQELASLGRANSIAPGSADSPNFSGPIDFGATPRMTLPGVEPAGSLQSREPIELSNPVDAAQGPQPERKSNFGFNLASLAGTVWTASLRPNPREDGERHVRHSEAALDSPGFALHYPPGSTELESASLTGQAGTHRIPWSATPPGTLAQSGPEGADSPLSLATPRPAFSAAMIVGARLGLAPSGHCAEYCEETQEAVAPLTAWRAFPGLIEASLGVQIPEPATPTGAGLSNADPEAICWTGSGRLVVPAVSAEVRVWDSTVKVPDWEAPLDSGSLSLSGTAEKHLARWSAVWDAALREVAWPGVAPSERKVAPAKIHAPRLRVRRLHVQIDMLLGNVAPEPSGWTASDCSARVRFRAAEPQTLSFSTSLPGWRQSPQLNQLVTSRAPGLSGWTASSYPVASFPSVQLPAAEARTLVLPTSLPDWRGSHESKQLGKGAGLTSRTPEVATWTEARPLAAAEAQALVLPTSLPDWRGSRESKQLGMGAGLTSRAPEVDTWTEARQLPAAEAQTLTFPTSLPDWRGSHESKQLGTGAGLSSRAPEVDTWTEARQLPAAEAQTLTFPTSLPDWRALIQSKQLVRNLAPEVTGWTASSRPVVSFPRVQLPPAEAQTLTFPTSLPDWRGSIESKRPESKQLVTSWAPKVTGWTASSYPVVSFPRVQFPAAEAQTLSLPTSLPDWRGSRESRLSGTALLGTASGRAPLWLASSPEPESSWVDGTCVDMPEHPVTSPEAASTNLLYPNLTALVTRLEPAVPPAIPVRLDRAVQFDRRRHHRPPKLLADSTGFQRVRAAAHIRIREPELLASRPSDLPTASARTSWRGLRIGSETIAAAGAPVPLRPLVRTPAWAE